MNKLYEEAGKGDKQRPTDHEKYTNNYDQIFRKQQPVNNAPNTSPTDSK
jgi:hypothetical protein